MGDNDVDSDDAVELESLPGLFGKFEEGYTHQYYFSETSHALAVLQGLSHQRSQEILCDVVICVDDQEFPCHRNVLAACSPYFLSMFTSDMRESAERRVSISGIQANIMKQLIDYAYTANITITHDNAQQLLSAANLVQIHSIREACCKFLEKEMDPSNCLGIHCFAEAHVCLKLSEKAKKFAEEHFTEVAHHEEILLLPQNKMIELISSDDLVVMTEEIVLDAVINWVKHEPESRGKHLAEVMQHVRLPLVSPYFLFDKIETESILSRFTECRALFDEAMKYFILKDRRIEMDSPRTKPRKCMATTEMIATIGGEIFNKNYLNCVDCYDFKEGKWWKLKDLPFPRCHHGAVLSDNSHIYIAGGFNKDKVVLNNVLRYEKVLDKWIRVASMNTSRARFGMAPLDGYIYAVGGFDGQSRTRSVERYCPDTNRWTFVASMNTAVSRCQAVGFNGYLYVAGGVSDPGNICVDKFERYNPRTDHWESLFHMPQAACLSALVVARNHIYAVGGTTDMITASKQLCRYDAETDKWTELSPMIETRFDAGAAAINGKIFVLSGHDGENSFYHSIEEYDLDTDTWVIVPNINLPFGRCRFGCVAIGIHKI